VKFSAGKARGFAAKVLAEQGYGADLSDSDLASIFGNCVSRPPAEWYPAIRAELDDLAGEAGLLMPGTVVEVTGFYTWCGAETHGQDGTVVAAWLFPTVDGPPELIVEVDRGFGVPVPFRLSEVRRVDRPPRHPPAELPTGRWLTTPALAAQPTTEATT
jgi:hypothetical protein